MTLKEYLGIEDNNFTINSDHLYIYHNNGNELVLVLPTKQKIHNPNIPTHTTPLTQFFQIPITKSHNIILRHNNKTIYKEIIQPPNKPGQIGDYTLPQSYTIIIYKQPNPNFRPNTPNNEIDPHRQRILDRWNEYINPEFSLVFTAYLNNKLQTTGNITIKQNGLPLDVYNNLPPRYSLDLTTIAVTNHLVPVAPDYPTLQTQLNQLEEKINNTII